MFAEKAMAPHSSTLAWKIPWTEEPGRQQSMGSLRVGRDWATSLSLFTFTHWRRKWQPTSSVLTWRIPGMVEFGGLRSMGSHRVGHDWSDLAAAAAATGVTTGLSEPVWPVSPNLTHKTWGLGDRCQLVPGRWPGHSSPSSPSIPWAVRKWDHGLESLDTGIK